MFTGLVEGMGTIQRLERRGPGYRLEVRAPLGSLEVGESVAVNGVCLTATTTEPHGFSADVSRETAERTNLGALTMGANVNLERALRIGDRLGGHLVSGHVDAVVATHRVGPAGEARRVVLELPPVLTAFVAPKGSVALDGVSLTVNDVRPGEFEVMLIPHTLGATTLANWSPGRAVNLEVDLLARYVVAALRGSDGPDRRPIGDGLASGGEEPAVDQGLIEALRRAGMM
ncbi:MAG: riboflavin synthase [Polyangiaceae bacterium]|nr:riboflavin synthase [Polyangiaceae bacterium]